MREYSEKSNAPLVERRRELLLCSVEWIRLEDVNVFDTLDVALVTVLSALWMEIRKKNLVFHFKY